MNDRRRVLVPIVLAVAVSAWAVVGIARSEVPPSCFGLAATIVGTPGDDVIRGTDGSDRIAGLGGNDVILAGDGRDVICAGSGDDRVRGGTGGDLVTGGHGDDRLYGGEGKDRLTGWDGPDGSQGRGSDVAAGGPDDQFAADRGPADDTYVGGPGHDAVSFDAATRGVRASLLRGRATGQGTDTLSGIEDLRGTAFDDVLVGDHGPNQLHGGSGPVSTIPPSKPSGRDALLGLGGDDRLDGWANDDRLRGGEGDDELADEVGRDVLFGGPGRDRLSTEVFEYAIPCPSPPTDCDPVKARHPGPDDLFGGPGQDVITGGDKDDHLHGGPGEDRLDGGPGTDSCTTGEHEVRCEDPPG